MSVVGLIFSKNENTKVPHKKHRTKKHYYFDEIRMNSKEEGETDLENMNVSEVPKGSRHTEALHPGKV